MTECRQLELTLNELRQVLKVLEDKEITSFIVSPVVAASQKLETISVALDNKGLSDLTKNLLLLLAKRNRLMLLSDVVEGFQGELDKSNGVVRGTVKSAVNLDQEERKQVENKVSEFFKKDIILNYTTEPKLVGGLLANVGSFTFDDSISSYLKRLNENQIKDFFQTSLSGYIEKNYKTKWIFYINCL